MFSNKFSKVGLSRLQVSTLKRKGKNKVTSVKFKNRIIQISSPYWFLHSVEELFLNEIYRFKSDTKKPHIIDCGANWGLSILYFKELYPEAHIVALEADPFIFQQLENNIKSFELKNIELINKAVWINNKEVQFSSEGAMGGTLASLGIREKNVKIVSAIRLKELIEQYNSIDFLKIDIEGAEYEVIKDCSDSLANVSNLFIEYHSPPQSEQTLDEILLWVRKAGFRYYIKEAWNNMDHPFVHKKQLYYDLQLNIFCFRN